METKTVNYEKKRWLILAASCLVALCIGSLYAWSVFASPMAEYLEGLTGKTITSLAIVFTVANSVGPITMICGGFINDKLGPKLVLIIGGILFGIGMIASGFVTSVAGLIVTYGLGVGLGVGMVYGTVVSNAVKFFPDKGGFAGGLTTACYGGSSIIVPIIATLLLKKYSITSCFKIIGAVMMVIIVAAAFVVEKCPANFTIGGDKGAAGKGAAAKAAGPAPKQYRFDEMLKTGEFYLMLLILMCGAFSGMMTISQASPISQRMMGMTAERAAIIVSVLAFFNMLGRLASGTLSDKLGAVKTLRITFAGSIIAGLMLWICKENTAALYYLGLAITGFCFGGIMGIYPGFTARQFGSKNNSVNYGIMFIGFALAGLFGPMIMNRIYNAGGRYQPAFLVAAVLAVVGEVLIVLLSRKTKEN